MSIPIENIYYLLSYAWDKLDENEKVLINFDDKTELLDLFAKILINSTKTLLKQGIDKSYVSITNEIAGIKGKLQISDTLKRQLLYKQRTICIFDEFSTNIISNQILFSTLNRLSRTFNLDKNLKKEIIGLQQMFGSIDLIPLKPILFKQVKISRNNRIYRFIINVCQIIYENTLPSEQMGTFKFTDFTRDPRKMNQLFEAFIRNFYRKEQDDFKTIRKENIKWQFSALETQDFNFLPSMQTDITLENENRKIIIDAKYYQETMVTYFDKERIHSNNLYQLFSYLLNQHTDEIKTKTATGILLYPTIKEEYNISFKYQDHNILIRTVNLNQNWNKISERLKEIILIN